jgi:CRISPR/Cas system CSM-associated protein Csm3 (group 7 of RAMP superfamily)
MKPYTLKLELMSPTLIGSGEGFGAVIDTDVVFDEVGLPFVPAKRIKGCLLDSAKEVQAYFNHAGIKLPVAVTEAFGIPGAASSAPVYFSSLFIEDYESNKVWLEYLLAAKQYGDVLSKEQILGTFTQIRQQTAIGVEGVAHDHSLRTIRVLNKGLRFQGALHMEGDDSDILNTLLLACLNFRHMGGKRNRGFGTVRCLLFDDEKELSINELLEESCTH